MGHGETTSRGRRRHVRYDKVCVNQKTEVNFRANKYK